MELIIPLFEYQHFFGHIAKPKSKGQESQFSLAGGEGAGNAKSHGKVLSEEFQPFHSSLYIHP